MEPGQELLAGGQRGAAAPWSISALPEDPNPTPLISFNEALQHFQTCPPGDLRVRTCLQRKLALPQRTSTQTFIRLLRLRGHGELAGGPSDGRFPACRRTSTPPCGGQAWLPSPTSCSDPPGCTESCWRSETWSSPSPSVSVGGRRWLVCSPHFLSPVCVCVCVGQLDNSQAVHLRVLQTIYKRLLGCRLDCPRYGPHWESIGFQGRAPGLPLTSDP